VDVIADGMILRFNEPAEFDGRRDQFFWYCRAVIPTA
jgi:hypothetical protein